MLDFATMRVPPADLSYVLERFTELAEQIDAVSEQDDADPGSPILLREAMVQLLNLLASLGEQSAGGHRDTDELTTYGDYGLHLLDQLGDAARRAERNDLHQATEQLSLSFALWVVRNGGELRQLRTVVNALVVLTDRADQPGMHELYSCSCELTEAASATYENRASSRPPEPWRRLLWHRALIATQSHNPVWMEPAFEAIAEHLPADADTFFAEVMEQVTIVECPDPVRDLVRQYFQLHCKPRRLH
jgi:hypothetical protein